MAWVRLSDGFHSDEKIVGLSLAARGLWATCASWSGDKLTEGFVPRHVAKQYGATKKIISELLLAQTWFEEVDGFRFVNWLKYNPTKERVLAEREQTRLRVQRHRNGVTVPLVTVPVTALPIPSRSREKIEDPDRDLRARAVANDRTLQAVPDLGERRCTSEGPSESSIGFALMVEATGLEWPHFRTELEDIGAKPAADRDRVLAALKVDEWVQSNRGQANPKHVLKHWNRYAVPPAPTPRGPKPSPMLAVMQQQLAAARQRARAHPHDSWERTEADREAANLLERVTRLEARGAS